MSTSLPVKNNFNIKNNILHVSIRPAYKGLLKGGVVSKVCFVCKVRKMSVKSDQRYGFEKGLGVILKI